MTGEPSGSSNTSKVSTVFGCANAASFQARYAGVDLAPAALRGRHLSLIVWATTLGAVIGPSLAAGAGTAVAHYGAPTIAGPFFFSALLFGLATAILFLFLRPDPFVVARELSAAAGAGAGEPPPDLHLRASERRPSARLPPQDRRRLRAPRLPPPGDHPGDG